MPVRQLKKSYSNIPLGIWAISLGAFLINISSVIVRSISPIYLTSVMGISISSLGYLEGAAEAFANLLKAFSGVISDYLRRRKFIVLLGYGMLTLSRPVTALSSTIQGIIFARLLERFGNGIQSTPRDALVADIAPKDSKGACFGLRVSLTTAGSFIGAFLALILMSWNNNDYHSIFWLASIPGICAIAIITLFVRDSKQNLHPKDHQPRHPIRLSDLSRLGKQYWTLMMVITLFTMAQYSDAFIVLHAHKNFGLSNSHAPYVLIIYNIGYSLSSYPVGRLSDHMNRYQLLVIGFSLLLLADLLLGAATSLNMLFAGVIVSGMQMGITQSLFMTLVADNVPADLRGTGFAGFYFISAISIFIANSLSGIMAQNFGESSAFFASFGIAALSLLFLLAVMRKKNQKIKQKSLRSNP